MYHATMFNKRLKQLRNEKDMTQEELADALHIPASTIRRLETNKIGLPRKERIEAFADYFNVSVDYLLGRTNDRNLVMSDESRTLVDSLELSDEEIMERIEFKIDGIPLTEEQIKSFLSYVRIVRAEGKKDT